MVWHPSSALQPIEGSLLWGCHVICLFLGSELVPRSLAFLGGWVSGLASATQDPISPAGWGFRRESLSNLAQHSM